MAGVCVCACGLKGHVWTGLDSQAAVCGEVLKEIHCTTSLFWTYKCLDIIIYAILRVLFRLGWVGQFSLG